jgi:hypothetical protein
LYVGPRYSKKSEVGIKDRIIVSLEIYRPVKKRAEKGGFCRFCMAENGPTYKPTYKKNPVIPRV